MQRSSFFDSQCQTVETEYVDWCKHLPQMVQKHSMEIQMMLPPRLQAFHKSMHAKLSKQDVLSVVELLKGIRLLQNDALRKIVSTLEELHQKIGSSVELLNLQSGWKGIPPNHFALQKPPRIGEDTKTQPVLETRETCHLISTHSPKASASPALGHYWTRCGSKVLLDPVE